VEGDLTPGSVVSESGLARELGMSRTPVGEAVRQLSAEGLLEQVPRVGTIVRNFGRQDLIDLFEMREALEGYAVQKAAERITSTQLAKLQALCDAMAQIGEQTREAGNYELRNTDLQTFLSADLAFHMLILQASGNQRMQDAVRQTRAVSRIFQIRRQKHDLRLVERAHSYHVSILEALRAGQGDQARRVMCEHIAVSKAQTLEQLERETTERDTNAALPHDLPEELAQQLNRIEQTGNQK
jgi:DNA-binding GntR family transcriptional regulator